MITRSGLFGMGRGAGKGRGGQDKRGRRYTGYNALSAHHFLERHLIHLRRCEFPRSSIVMGACAGANSRFLTQYRQ